jgi:hypothetical protein
LSRDVRLTKDIRAVVRELEAFLGSTDSDGRVVCAAKCGVYAFYDYDGEPIYVGQTYERLSSRIRRHLTNQRTDAVAMHVLDPLEVARVEVWPFWELEDASTAARREKLDKAEYTVHEMLSQRAQVSKLLNEKAPTPTERIELPQSHARDIIPEDIRDRLGHKDERISRRASTIANLAQVVKERDVSIGLRQTLVTQARRLELLSRRRLSEVVGEATPEELAGETTRAGTEDPPDAEA